MAMRCRLYYITDRSQFHGDENERRRSLLDKVSEAARAEIDFIQIREKDLSGRQLENLARDAMAAVLENSSPTRLLINSRIDVALAVGAEGVHLRGNDVAPDEVRRLWALFPAGSTRLEKPIVAASCHSRADVERAASQAVDLAVFAPVFGKHSVPGAQPKGLDALHDACQFRIPVLALGGVTLENARTCLMAGAAGVAGIRLFQENEIQDVVCALREL